MNLSPVIETSFKQYAGAVLQSRALVDVRDCLKPSARQIFYSMYINKLTASKPHKKTNNAVGLAMVDFYVHGDSSCEGIIYRAGQPFAMRYPLTDIHGNGGNIMKSGNWAAARYTSSRLSPFCDYIFKDIDKDVIQEWRDNYDDTKQYPAVTSSKGFYNIVNGTMGIGIGAASSIPQFNLNDVNNALIHLLQHPDSSFDDIYCAPDFSTGAILLNEKEVKDSLKNGTGFACKLRSVIEYDSGSRCFIVKEIPFSVYTNTICGELEDILNGEDNPGIERFNDLSAGTPNFKIYLTKKANPDKVLRFLYKNTSLQYHYGINMTMLDNGRFPKVFTWKEALQAHIDHEKEVYRRGFEFDLKKINARLHIIKGLLIAMARIEEVVDTIKKSSSTALANKSLQKKFLLTEIQAKAILDMKLSRLAHLEVRKLEEEETSLEAESARITLILTDENLFNNELINGWKEVAKKHGDARRTKILNVEDEDDEEPTEVRALQVSLTNHNNIFVTETSSLYTQKRGSVGAKLKLDNGEYIISSRTIDSNEEILFFTQVGNFYHCAMNNLTLDEKISLYNVLPLKEWENICAMTSMSRKESNPYILFFTKKGFCKKSELAEYNIKRKGSLKAITLDEDDEIVSVAFTDNSKAGVLSEQGNFLLVETKDIRAIGRVTKGIKVIKLNDGDKVISARLVPDTTKTVASISGEGMMKQTSFSEFVTQGKNTKGAKIQKLNECDWMADFSPIVDEKEILVASTRACLKLSIADIPVFGKNTQGSKTIKLNTKDSVVGLSI